jgi:glucose-6-phosphate 1-dehydrogenase
MSLVKADLSGEQTICPEYQAPPFALVIFGASGDLVHRKLFPSLYRLYARNLMPEKFYILGFARTEKSTDSFREEMKNNLKSKLSDYDEKTAERFVRFSYYMNGNYDDIEAYQKLQKRMDELDKIYNTGKIQVFYMAVPPNIYCQIIKKLVKSGTITDTNYNGQESRQRVVIEKPFGRDLKTAVSIDNALKDILHEKQIYRIDHYLGKETVQNILMFRFANTVFEPIWNRRYIDNIQITVAEQEGVGHRGGYYEQAGLLRDMFQNHMMQMMSMVAMEPPVSFEADRVRDEKVKLIRSIRPFPVTEIDRYFIRGQYGHGKINDDETAAYHEEPGVRSDSYTETYVAARMFIDNWRWQGVPFYLRSGKRMAKRISYVVVNFKKVPYSIFSHMSPQGMSANRLIFHVQPEEGISLEILAKTPGSKLCMSSLKMEFKYQSIFGVNMPDAYERLLLDCIKGDQSLFIRSDDMRESWSLYTPILEQWEAKPGQIGSGFLYRYQPGTWGPEASYDLLQQDGRTWYEK